MIDLVAKYVECLVDSYNAAESGDSILEETILDAMDELWLQMSDNEHRDCDERSRAAKFAYIANGRQG